MKDTYKLNPYYVIYKFSIYGNSHYYTIAFSKNPFIALRSADSKRLRIEHSDLGSLEYVNKNLCYEKNIGSSVEGLWRSDFDAVIGYPKLLADAYDFTNGFSYDSYYFSSHAISGFELKPFPYELSDSAVDNPAIVYPGVIPLDKVPDKVITNPDDTIPFELDKIMMPDGTIDRDYVDTNVGELVLNPPTEQDKPLDKTYPWLPNIVTPLDAITGLLKGILDGILSIPGILQKIWEWLTSLTWDSIVEAILSIPLSIWELFTTTLTEMALILQSILGFLNGMVIALVDALMFGLQTLFKLIFIPDMKKIQEKLDEVIRLFNEKFPFIKQIRDLLLLFAGIKEGKLATFDFTYRGATVSLVNFTPFKAMIGGIHALIIALAYFRFVRRLYVRVPSIIGGFGNDN